MSILPLQKKLEIPSGGARGSQRPKALKEMYDACLDFPEGWRGLWKNPFRGGGMDNLWNYSLYGFIVNGKF